MNEFKTNDELIKELLTLEEQKELKSEIKEISKKIRGGYRVGSGRHKKDENKVLKFQIRVSKEEKEFLNYARSHNFNYSELMQG